MTGELAYCEKVGKEFANHGTVNPPLGQKRQINDVRDDSA